MCINNIEFDLSTRAELFIKEYQSQITIIQDLIKKYNLFNNYNTINKSNRNKLFAFLRDESILQEDNEPYQKYITAGYFRVVMNKYLSGNQYITHYKTLVTNKGVDFILRRYLAVYPEATKNKIQDIIQTATNMTISDIIKSDEIA